MLGAAKSSLEAGESNSGAFEDPAWTRCLAISTAEFSRANRPTLVQSMMAGSNAKYEADIYTLSTVADESKPPAKLSNTL